MWGARGRCTRAGRTLQSSESRRVLDEQPHVGDGGTRRAAATRVRAPFSELATTCSKVMLRTRAAAVVGRRAPAAPLTKIGSPSPKTRASSRTGSDLEVAHHHVARSRVRAGGSSPDANPAVRVLDANVVAEHVADLADVEAVGLRIRLELDRRAAGDEAALSRRTCCMERSTRRPRRAHLHVIRSGRRGSRRPCGTTSRGTSGCVPLSTSMPSAVPHCTEPSTRTPISRTLEQRESWHQFPTIR